MTIDSTGIDSGDSAEFAAQVCGGTGNHDGQSAESCDECAPYWAPFVTGESQTHLFGDVTITEHGVAIRATHDQLYEWSYRPGYSWPCSTLDDLDSVTVAFDSGGLVELEQSPAYDEESGANEIMGDELNAWSSDVLRGVLPIDHPAYFVTVGQFES